MFVTIFSEGAQLLILLKRESALSDVATTGRTMGDDSRNKIDPCYTHTYSLAFYGIDIRRGGGRENCFNLI